MEDFPKNERICKDNDIQSLFNQGTGFSCYPFRVVYLFRSLDGRPVTCRLLLSVSKKRFHHAVKRNRVKRLIRESWRKNKGPLYEFCRQHTISVDVALVYTATVILPFEEMLRKTDKAVKELIHSYEKKTIQTTD